MECCCWRRRSRNWNGLCWCCCSAMFNGWTCVTRVSFFNSRKIEKKEEEKVSRVKMTTSTTTTTTMTMTVSTKSPIDPKKNCTLSSVQSKDLPARLQETVLHRRAYYLLLRKVCWFFGHLGPNSKISCMLVYLKKFRPKNSWNQFHEFFF